MKTFQVIEAYLTARRVQGVKLSSSTRVLKRFTRKTGDTELDQVTPSPRPWPNSCAGQAN